MRIALAYLAFYIFVVVSGGKRLVLHSDQDILTKIIKLETRVNQLEQENHLLRNSQGGSSYVIWGRTNCPGNGTRLVYRGYAAGSYHFKAGGGVNTLCMPEDPTWNRYSSNEQLFGNIYGSEVDTTDSKHVLGFDYNNQDIPCALCQTDRSTTVMIPGRANCYPGWTQEYTGYILSGLPERPASTDFICLNERPEAVPRGGANDDGHIMYFVKSTCSSLACPPYVDGRELACVICSY